MPPTRRTRGASAAASTYGEGKSESKNVKDTKKRPSAGKSSKNEPVKKRSRAAPNAALAQRMREQLKNQKSVQEKNMFGGITFMVDKKMCCGIVGDQMMARVGPEAYEACLKNDFASVMDFTGRPMKGFVFVALEGVAGDESLKEWIDACLAFVQSLPEKK